jgi:hypothetical protein
MDHGYGKYFDIVPRLCYRRSTRHGMGNQALADGAVAVLVVANSSLEI